MGLYPDAIGCERSTQGPDKIKHGKKIIYLPFFSPAGVVFTNGSSSTLVSFTGFFFSPAVATAVAATGAGVLADFAANLAAFSNLFASFLAV